MRIFRFLLFLFLLTACTPNAVVVESPNQLLPTVLPTGPEAVRTLLPVPSRTLAQPETAYPVATEQDRISGPPAYPYPDPQGLLENHAVTPAPFQDCARTPGLAGCDPQALPISGRVALSDRAAARLVMLDLANGKGWQSPGIVDGLAWSPAGDQLLSWHDSEGGRANALWNANGAPGQAALSDEILRWQADGTLAQQNMLRYPGGNEYRLDLDPAKGWVLRIRSAAGEREDLVIDDWPADRQYLLLERIPGGEDLLTQSFLPTNLGMTGGGSLLRIGLQKDEVQPLGIDAPLPPAASLVWNPVQQGLLAFTASGAEPGAAVLAFFDFTSQKFNKPLPPGVQVTALDWSPDGQRLAFTAEPVAGIISAAGKEDFPAAGIYLFDLKTGQIETALLAPSGAVDGWVHWTADGRALIYGRLLRDGAGNVSGAMHLYDLETRRDTVLFDGLAISQGARVISSWQALISYTR